MIPKDLRYHQEHEWVRVSGTRATVGISHFAQDADRKSTRLNSSHTR